MQCCSIVSASVFNRPELQNDEFIIQNYTSRIINYDMQANSDHGLDCEIDNSLAIWRTDQRGK